MEVLSPGPSVLHPAGRERSAERPEHGLSCEPRMERAIRRARAGQDRNRPGGDDMRRGPRCGKGAPVSSGISTLASLTSRLKNARGIAHGLNLVRQSDVLVEVFRPRVMERLRIGSGRSICDWCIRPVLGQSGSTLHHLTSPPVDYSFK